MLTEEVTMATISSTARQIGLMIVLAVLFAMLLTKSRADSPSDQKRPCTGDAFLICKSKIPSADRIIVGMRKQRARASESF
jgi:hypothetical protein